MWRRNTISISQDPIKTIAAAQTVDRPREFQSHKTRLKRVQVFFEARQRHLISISQDPIKTDAVNF